MNSINEKNTLTNILRLIGGTLLVLLGTFVIYGWYSQNLFLIQISPEFVPMQYNAALCFLLTGIAWIVLVFNFRKLCQLILSVILIINLLTLIQHTFDINLGIDQLFITPFTSFYILHPGRIPVNASVCFVLISIIFLFRTLPKQTYYSIQISLFLSFLIFSLGFSVLINYLAGGKFSWGYSAFMAFHGSIAFTLIGINFFVILTQEESEPLYFSALLPGVILFILTLFLWQNFLGFENRQIYKIIHLEANRLREVVQISLEERVLDISRIATWARFRNTLDESERITAAYTHLDSLLHHFPPYLAIAEVDSKFHIRKISFSDSINPDFKSALQTELAQLKSKNDSNRILFTFESTQKTFFGILIPIKKNQVSSGFILGVLSVDSILDPLTHRKALKDRYSISLTEEEKPIYSIRSSDEANQKMWEQSEPFIVDGLNWSLHLWPTRSVLLELRSPLSNLILLFGVFTAGFVSLVLLFTHKIKFQTDLLSKSAASLTQSNSFLQSILNGAHYGIISTNLEGIILTYNKATEKMLGYSAEEMIGKRTPEIFHDPQEIKARAEELSVEIKKPITPGFEVLVAKTRLGISDEREWTYIRKDKSRFPVSLSITPIYSSDQTITGFMGIAIDITLRKEVDRIKNEFISTVSHELRTPLTSIRGSLGIIIAGMAGEVSEKVKTLLQIGVKNCDRLTQLITDILDLEKIEAGKMTFNLAPTLLLPLLKQTLEINQTDASLHQIRLVLEKELSEATANVDSNKFIEAVTNILSNAIKFSPENGIVKINMTRHNSFIRISVSDQGPGIPEEFKSRIFQKFSQADSSNTRHKGGTGLGLSITKQIVEKMGGTINFETSSKGSTFYFDLPEVELGKK